MSTNEDSSGPSVSPDDLAACALDAHDAEEAATIAAHLDSHPGAIREYADLRSAAGEYAATVTSDLTPPPHLRSRVLAAAGRRRAPTAVVAGASPTEVQRVEAARAILLLRDLTADDWARPVDPPELAGWTVTRRRGPSGGQRDAAGRRAGCAGPRNPRDGHRQRRPHRAGARPPRRTPPALAVDELEAAAEATDAELAARGEARLDEPIDWWGQRLPRRLAVLVRAFETWTHADDIRRAVGADVVDPPPASLLTMAHTACGLVPTMLAMRGRQHPDRLVRFRFTDLEDAAWDVDLGATAGVRPAGNHAVDAEAVTDAAALCRVVSPRVDPRRLAYTVIGDERLAGDVVDALPALALL